MSIQRILEALEAFYNILMGEAQADSGSVSWGITTSQAYLPGDPTTILNLQFLW